MHDASPRLLSMATELSDVNNVVASLNVKGLNSPAKRSLVYILFWKEGLSILLLQ